MILVEDLLQSCVLRLSWIGTSLGNERSWCFGWLTLLKSLRMCCIRTEETIDSCGCIDLVSDRCLRDKW